MTIQGQLSCPFCGWKNKLIILIIAWRWSIYINPPASLNYYDCITQCYDYDDASWRWSIYVNQCRVWILPSIREVSILDRSRKAEVPNAFDQNIAAQTKVVSISRRARRRPQRTQDQLRWDNRQESHDDSNLSCLVHWTRCFARDDPSSRPRCGTRAVL